MRTSITPGQVDQAAALVRARLGKMTDVSPEKFQDGVLAMGGKFQDGVEELIRKLAFGQFADEEVASSYGYFSGYDKPKSIAEQTSTLRQLFPELGSVDEQIATGTLPPNAEGWFAIPRWQKVAKTYTEAVQKVLDLIKKARNNRFYNYREGQIDQQHLRLSAKTARMLETIGEQQKDHDILVVPCQFGKRHAGRSVRRALEVMSAEFGLDPFSVGIMLLTHPERLQHYNDLWIDCAGAEFSDAGDGVFDHAPFFLFYDGKVKFDTNDVSYAYDYSGSASGFAPQ